MAVSKSPTTFTWASGSSTTSGTTNAISTATANSATVFGSIAVSGSPTVGATVQVQESPDGGTTWYSSPVKLFTAGLTAAASPYPFEIGVDPTASSVRLVYVVQTGGTSSTFTAQLGTASE